MSDMIGIQKKRNFRDLGGYLTVDGRRIKNGYFYRSSRLSDFDETELAVLHQLNIRKIYDLRSLAEVKQAPDPIVSDAEYVHSSAIVNPDGTETNFSPAALKKEVVYSRENNNRFTAQVYGELPFSLAYKKMFRDIMDRHVPLLFHCTAGKDRTGIAAMLILLALGVDEETIMYDYMLTNEYRKEYIDDFKKKFPLMEADAEMAGMLLAYEGVSYLNAEYSLRRIKEKYASYDEYFAKEFNLDQHALQQLKLQYTE